MTVAAECFGWTRNFYSAVRVDRSRQRSVTYSVTGDVAEFLCRYCAGDVVPVSCGEEL
jgi:hypothetical protein